MKIDLHVHTHRSPDSLMDPRALAVRVEEQGVVPAITDHNTLRAHAECRQLKMPFIPGEEIRTDRGDLIGLYLQEAIPKHTPFLEAIDSIREQGGISIVPHMYDSTRHVVNAPKLASRADAIEVFNARCPLNEQNEKALAFAKKYKRLHSAGSDSHFDFEFGRAYVEVPEFDISDSKALLKALKKGKVHGRKAPFFVRGTTLMVKWGKKLLGKH